MKIVQLLSTIIGMDNLFKNFKFYSHHYYYSIKVGWSKLVIRRNIISFYLFFKIIFSNMLLHLFIFLKKQKLKYSLKFKLMISNI